MKKNIMKDFEEIVESRNLSEDAKKIISKRIISNFAFGISFIILLLSYNIASIWIYRNTAEIIYYVSAMVFLLLTIITFEVGYKKDDGKYAITGIEILIFSLFSLFAPYIFYIFNSKYITAMVCLVTLYYIVKIIVIYNKEKSKAFKENNDISVIIKKESEDKLAKKFGMVKNDEIKTVIVSEKQKKAPRKKTTSKTKASNKTKQKQETSKKTNKSSQKNTEKNEEKKEIKTVVKKDATNKKNTTKKTTQNNKNEEGVKKTSTKKNTSKNTTTKRKEGQASNTTKKATKEKSTSKSKSTTKKGE